MSMPQSAVGSSASTQHSEFKILGFSGARAVAFLMLVAFILFAPIVIYPVFLMKVYVFMIYACAYNMLLGYAGLMSFGHAAFFGMGAYLTAWTAVRLGLSTELALFCGTTVGAILGLIIGWLAIRRRGLYFAMITLAFAQMIYFICLKASFTGGENGIQDVPRGVLFGFLPLSSDQTLYWVVGLIVLLILIFVNRIIHSPFGELLKAIKENEIRATSLGYNVNSYKLVAFVISAGLSGFAGGLKVLVFGISTLVDVSTPSSTEVVLMGLIGGFGTVFGPIIGAVTLMFIEYFLTPFGSWVTIIQGIIFMVFVLLFRHGIVGEIQTRLNLKL
jgi:branched-chain amino acid transport system permease protein